MEKKKQSKKRWAWTERQKRRHWGHGNWYSVPNDFVRKLHRANKTLEKMAIRKYMRGDFEKDVQIRYQRSSAGYDYF